jgi:hypothetical protein
MIKAGRISFGISSADQGTQAFSRPIQLAESGSDVLRAIAIALVFDEINPAVLCFTFASKRR